MTNQIDLLEPDRGQLERFVGGLFRHAEGEGFFSVRAFFDSEAELKPFRIQSVPLAAGLPYLIRSAEDIAQQAANEPKRSRVHRRRWGVLQHPKQAAREEDLTSRGLVLSVDCDEHPRQRVGDAGGDHRAADRDRAVRAGDGPTRQTGEVHDKLHSALAVGAPGAVATTYPKLKQGPRAGGADCWWRRVKRSGLSSDPLAG